MENRKAEVNDLEREGGLSSSVVAEPKASNDPSCLNMMDKFLEREHVLLIHYYQNLIFNGFLLSEYFH